MDKSFSCTFPIKVRILEDDPAFDAGKGSVLTKEGQVKYSSEIIKWEASGIVVRFFLIFFC